MIRCENCVALDIRNEMVRNEYNMLKLLQKQESVGCSKEIGRKEDQMCTPTTGVGLSNLKGSLSVDNKMEEGVGINYLRFADTDRYEDTEGTDEEKHDIQNVDTLTENTRTVSRSSTSLFKDILSASRSVDSNISQDDDPDRKMLYEWNDGDEQRFNDIFLHLDVDSDGAVTFKDLKEGAQLFGWNPTGTEIELLTKDMDIDGNEKVTRREFKAYFKEFISKLQHPVKVLEDSIDVMMAAIEKDGSGRCSRQEFREFVQLRGDSPLTDSEIEELFNQLDTANDDATLNKDDLLRLLTTGIWVN